MINSFINYLLIPKVTSIALIRLFFPRYGLSKSDIILATFPKSGTTWFRFIWANIISLTELNGIEVDFSLLNEKLNSSFDRNWTPVIKYHSLPLLRNTHRKFNKKMFKDNKSIYIYRNPADTMVSYYFYRKSLKKNSYKGTFSEFIRDDKYGINAWVEHINSWINNATVIITYEELKDDPINIVRLILKRLKIKNIPEEIYKTAIKKSDINKIKMLERIKGKDKNAQKMHIKDFNFARNGEAKQWISIFSTEDLDFLKSKLKRSGLNDFIEKYEY